MRAISKRSIVALGATLALLLGVSAILVYWAGWRSVVDSASAISPQWIAAAAMTSLGNYGIRFMRWQLFLRALGHRVPWRRSATIFVGGLALTGTPGKVGELVRSVYLARYGVPYAKSFQLFFWDRFSDLVGVLLLAVMTGSLIRADYAPLIGAIAGLIVALWIFRPGGRPFVAAMQGLRRVLPRRARAWVLPLLDLQHTDARFTASLVAIGILAGTMAYGLHGLGLYLIANAISAPLDLSQCVLTASLSTLAGAVVFLPAGAGMVEMTTVGLLVVQGLGRTDAVTLGLVHRAVTFWFAIGLGGICLIALSSIRPKP